MRTAFLVVILALAPLLGTAQAQSPDDEAGSIHVSDPAGDVRISPNNSTAPSQFSYLDLLGFWVSNESLYEIEFGLQLADLEEPAVDGGSREVGIFFNFGKAQHTASFRGGPSCAGNFRSDFGNSIYSRCVDAEVDLDAGIARFRVPREYIVNDTFVMFGSGHKLDGFYAYATAAPDLGGFVSARETLTVYDRAPDFGVGPVYESALGNSTSSGALRLQTPEPVRLSNGESTTLVYPLTIYNDADRDDDVLITIQNPEPAWSLRVPPRVKVAAHGEVTVPVILSMGFEHRHGQIAYFHVRAESIEDKQSWSVIDLGVFWLDIPQPAGHHNKLWFHSGPVNPVPLRGFSVGLGVNVATCAGARLIWMNPLEEDESQNAEDGPAPACPFGETDVFPPPTYATEPTAEWYLPLVPELLIGLDFDLTRTAQLVTSVRSATTSTAASLDAILLYCDPTNATGPSGCTNKQIAHGTGGPVALAAGAERQFEIELAVNESADHLPFQRNSNLGLLLRLLTETPSHPPNTGGGGTGPELIIAGSELVLPLIEYHDPIDQAFQAVGTLHLESLSPFEKPLNPGRTALFVFDVRNEGDRPQTLLASVEGPNLDWATILPVEEFEVPAKGRRNLTIAVTAPDDASPEERAELFVVLESKTDPNVIAISRLRATVVDPAAQDVPNEDPAASENTADGTPGFEAFAIAAAFAGLAWVRRRRL